MMKNKKPASYSIRSILKRCHLNNSCTQLSVIFGVREVFNGKFTTKINFKVHRGCGRRATKTAWVRRRLTKKKVALMTLTRNDMYICYSL